MKSKGIAYLLWFFLGVFGVHKFYLEKIAVGIIYFLTGGLFLIGWIYDLFTLGNQVDVYNALHLLGFSSTHR
ncbi:MAG: NINE protein [Ignavibacteriae bacterium]|nr:NINE protein [Ignavibacteriota bacterium]